MSRAVRTAAAAASLALIASVVVSQATTAGAADPFSVSCADVAGNVNSSASGDQVTWMLSGVGTCVGDPSNPPYLVTISGTGVSSGRGVCTTGVAVTNLVLSVNVSMVSTSGGPSFFWTETWTATPNLGVVAVPFTISGGTAGAGTIFTRIFGQCPGAAGSSPAATYDWVQNL